MIIFCFCVGLWRYMERCQGYGFLGILEVDSLVVVMCMLKFMVIFFLMDEELI